MISTLEEVPPYWIKVKFEDIAKNITKRIDNPAESGLEYYIGLEHLDTDQIRIKRFGSTDDVKATKFLCKKGDIIFGKRRAYLRKVAVTDRGAVVSAHSMVIRPKGDLIVPEFLPCFMQSSIFWKTAHALSEGSLSPTIKWKTLVKQEFWIPSIDEQKKIVKLLNSIEENIIHTERICNIKSKLRANFLTELLTKGIGHTKFKETEIGFIPENWNILKLKEVADIIMGQSPPSSSYNGFQGLPLLQGKADFGIMYPIISKYTTNPSKIADKGDILFTVRAPVGEINWCTERCCIGRGIAALRPKENVIPEYLYFQLEKLRFNFEQFSQGTIFTAINSNELKNSPIAVASLVEQQKIIDILSNFDKSIAEFAKHESWLLQLKKKFTDEFISGRIRIPEEALRNVQ